MQTQEQLAERIEAAIATLNEAQERSQKIAAELSAKYTALDEALKNRKEGDPPVEGAMQIVPLAFQENLQSVVVQLRGEFIEALKTIKG